MIIERGETHYFHISYLLTINQFVLVVSFFLQRGFVLPDSRLAVLTEAEATGRRRTRRGTRPRRQAALRVFEDLTPGDFVVHEQHGVARFAGLVRRMLAGVERDYLLLEYRGEDRLYLPTDRLTQMLR